MGMLLLLHLQRPPTKTVVEFALLFTCQACGQPRRAVLKASDSQTVVSRAAAAAAAALVGMHVPGAPPQNPLSQKLWSWGPAIYILTSCLGGPADWKFGNPCSSLGTS